MSTWVVSADLGQMADPTAVAILEVTSRREMLRQDKSIITPHDMDVAIANHPGSLEVAGRIDCRYLERLPLRMPYPAQVEVIAGLLRRPPLNTYPPATLVVDQTGVGRPVTDLFRRVGLRPVPITITAGDTESTTPEGDYRVSKLLLVSRLQALLHSGEFRISPKLKEAKTLANELGDFRATFSESGYVRYGAREGAHDDLVLAVALGCYWASRQRPMVFFETGALQMYEELP